ncbi:MAG: PBSX family phage terminase large subunit, partial [Desulfobulbaceae bacterium]|nr:PBSX family phage terminase large subunit [Desulfobulbaceae bacterium]
MYRRIPPNEVRVGIVPAFRKLPLTKKRYIFAQGGRGGGKSIAVADDLLLKSCNEKAIFLCTREVQKSIKDSVMSLLKERIEVLNLSSIFDITGTEIRNLRTGSTFIFAGLKEHTIDSIKSYANVKYCWVEEAHSVSKKSLDYLTPTIRVPDAQIYFTFNKFSEADPVAIRWNREMTETRKFQVRTDDGKIYTWTEHSGDDAYGVFINYDGNPYFPPALYRDMLKDKEEDYEYYLHIWEGQALNQSDTAVLSRKMVLKAMRVKTGEPDFDDWKFGIDVARFGDDRTQFYLANKYKVIASKTMRKLDTVQVTMKAIEFLEDNI